MKGQTLRNAIEAHGWVGVILSVPLFVVFWAGAITLFFPEVSLWSRLPVTTVEPAPRAAPKLRELLDYQLTQLPPRTDGTIWLFPANERAPHIKLFVPLKQPELAKSDEHEGVLLDPRSGSAVAKGHTFKLAGFLFELHFNLNVPQGHYIVGVVSLFFLVLLMTGIVVQLKNLIADFFLYRHQRGRRQRLNDIHTVAGVLTLPFATLYALTGLMLNLSVLFQLPSLLLVYGGDQAALMGEAGYPEFESKPAGVAAAMPQLEPIIERFEREQGARVTSLGLNHYGDQNAVIQLQGVRRAGFPDRLVQVYEVKTGKMHQLAPSLGGQAFSKPVDTLLKLHVADFGGTGVRVLLYLLALGVCGMIVAGNLLWLAKREAKLTKYTRSFAVVRGLTIGGCVGAVVATSVAFALERTLPVGFPSRALVVKGAFVGGLTMVTVAGFFIRQVKPFLRRASWATAALLLVPTLVDALAYRPQIAALWEQGHRSAAGVSIGFLVHAMLFAWLAVALQTEREREATAGEGEMIA